MKVEELMELLARSTHITVLEPIDHPELPTTLEALVEYLPSDKIIFR